MKNTWFISDTHFYHKNIIRFCQRPFDSVEEMNEMLIKNWNDRVLPEDTVYFLGDFLNPRGKHPGSFLKRLSGNIVFIQGNHDGRKLLSRIPNWTSRMYLNFGGFKFLLKHYPEYPVEVQDRYTTGRDRLPEDSSGYKVDFILSGHRHNNGYEEDGKKIGLRWTGRSLNLSVEVNNYAPVHADEVLAYCRKRQVQMKKKGYKIEVPANEVC